MPARKKSMANGSDASLKTRLARGDPRKLTVLAEGENARYMTDAQFDRLVQNLKADGVMTSLPLVYSGKVLSGNHRVKAAIAAGLAEIDYIDVTSKLTRQRQTALQLSHNAIAGQDDPNTLSKLYGGLDLSMKGYSGLVDDDLSDIADIDTTGLTVGSLKYDEMRISFLPEQREAFLAFLAQLKGEKKPVATLVARLEDFDEIFDALCETKELAHVHNTAAALVVMARLAVERLAQLIEEPDGSEGEG